MDSSAVYESGDGSDDESCYSDEEQVIEISSHSRIVVSPRKVRSSAWGEKSQRSSRRCVKPTKRMETQTQQSRGVRRSLGSSSNRSTPRIQRPPKSRTSGSNQITSATNNHSAKKKSNNFESSSEGDSDGSISSGHVDSEVSSDDSDASFEDALKKPVRGSSPRKQIPKKGSRAHFGADADGASMQSLGAPTTPGKEMEELKATLKKLAHHDDGDSNPAASRIPNISSTAALREYLTAATTLERTIPAAEQIRRTEYAGVKSRHASFHPPRSSSYMSAAPIRTKSKSMREKSSNNGSKQDYSLEKFVGASGSAPRTGTERFSLNKKLFSVPPPPSGIFSGLSAGSGVPFQTNSANGSGGSQGSRAVLSALKALQDKIGRLEEERETLKQQLSDAKLTARRREAELISTEKKISYELGQTKESARAAYDALRCDREELKLQLVKSEERRKALQAELYHFQEITQTLSDKSDDLQSRLQISEAYRIRVKTEMKEAENDHKIIAQEMKTELTQLRQELQTAVERNELLEAQFQRESSNHSESSERLRESEQTVASLSQLNEKLVTKVWEATEAANQAIKKNKKLLQQQRPSTLLRPTAASRASAAAASEATARRRGTTASTASQKNTGASRARTLKKKKTSTGTNSSMTKKLKQPKTANNMTLLREANLGKEIPFLLGNSVQPSFSLIGNIQDALRRCETTYMMPTLHGGVPATPESTSSRRQTANTIQNSLLCGGEPNSAEADTDTPQQHPPPVLQSPQPTNEDAVAAPSSQIQPPKSTPSGHRRSTEHKPPAIKVPTVSPKTYASPMQNQIMDDLCTAVRAAEKEFTTLNKRYKDLVAQMEANNRRGTPGSECGTKSSTTSMQLSQALGPLLDELEAKAKQLNLLKQVYQQAANSTINPPRHVVLSPEAIRRKTASLRLLHEYRQLESDSKNKGSGRSASPSSNLGATGFFH